MEGGFDEMLEELIELNGYNITKTEGSKDGYTDIIAIKSDDVGQKIRYLIRCKKNGGLVDKNDVEELVVAQKRHPGGISIIASNMGISRVVQEVAETFGVRLWGELEIEKLRRNVVLKRNSKLRQVVDYTNVEQPNSKKSSNTNKHIIAIVIILLISYIYLYQFDFIYNRAESIGEQIPIQSINDTNVQEFYDDSAHKIDQISAHNLYDRVEQEIDQKHISSFVQAKRDELKMFIQEPHEISKNISPIINLVEDEINTYFN